VSDADRATLRALRAGADAIGRGLAAAGTPQAEAAAAARLAEQNRLMTDFLREMGFRIAGEE